MSPLVAHPPQLSPQLSSMAPNRQAKELARHAQEAVPLRRHRLSVWSIACLVLLLTIGAGWPDSAAARGRTTRSDRRSDREMTIRAPSPRARPVAPTARPPATAPVPTTAPAATD